MDRLSAALPAHKSAFFSASVPLSTRAVAPPRHAASPSTLPPISNIFFLRPRAPPPPPPSQEPPSTGKVPAPGRYGGAPLDKRIRQSWGGKEEDPLESGEYIWNTEWKKTVTVDDADKNKAAAEDPIASAVSSNDPGTSDGGFLSLGRSLALDSMDVDLSAELNRPSKATLEKQVEAARRAAGMQAQQASSEGKIKWRYAPTTKEERQWAEANRKSAKMVMAFVEKEEPLTPQQIAERERQQYEKLKQSLVLTTLGLGVVFTGTAAVLYSPEVAVSYAVGAVGSLVYVRMLSSSVEALGANSVQGAVRGAVGQPRLLVPVVLVMAFNRWNEILVPQYGAVPLELIPMLVGFFTYKAATITQALQDMLAPLASPPSASSSTSSASSESSAGPSAAPPTSSTISTVPVDSAFPAYPAHPSRSAYSAHPSHSAHSAHPSPPAHSAPFAGDTGRGAARRITALIARPRDGGRRWYGGDASGRGRDAGEEEEVVVSGELGGHAGGGGEAGGDDEEERREADVEAVREEDDASMDLSWHPSGLVLLEFRPFLPYPSPFLNLAHPLLAVSSPLPIALAPPLFAPPFLAPPFVRLLSSPAPMRPPPLPFVLPSLPQPSARLPCLTPSEAAQLLTKGRARDIRILHFSRLLPFLLLSFPPHVPLFSAPPLLPAFPPLLLSSLLPSQPSASLPSLSPSEAAQLLTKGRARDIRILNVAGRCQWAEHLVLASAHSTRHARGLAAGLAYELKQRYARQGMAAHAPEVEGKEAEHWMLLDCGRTVVHVMTEEGRRRYKVEALWEGKGEGGERGEGGEEKTDADADARAL
ncbi:unnamed protein product [Closterium sp. NIES-65]|nr:unnamed protein product [Closterium sp. NIES-65]